MDPETATDKLVLKRYQAAMDYYWRASRTNKRWFKVTRYLTVVLGALVTLVSSISSATFVEGIPELRVAFAVGTPVMAACLAIVGGFAQSFQWGATWKEMVLAAQHLEKEYDRFQVTPEAERDAAREMKVLNDLVLQESSAFFSRIVGTPSTMPSMTGKSNTVGSSTRSDTPK